jgi:hypothetical protein
MPHAVKVASVEKIDALVEFRLNHFDAGVVVRFCRLHVFPFESSPNFVWSFENTINPIADNCQTLSIETLV